MANNYIRRQFSDTVSYTDQLNGSITNSATTFTLKDGTTFPTGSVGPFVVTIDPNLSSEEKVLCSSRTGSSFTVASSGRGFGGTTAVAHNSNASVIHTICGQDLDEANQAVVSTVGAVTTAGDMLYATGANVLTRLGVGAANKVLSSSGTAPQWSTLLGLIEDQFTAGGQIIQGTGSGTGQLIQLLAAIEAVFTAQGQLLAGTGSGAGELLAKGSAGTSLTVGGADASGLEWIQVLGASLGLTGATAATRFAGGTASGAPASGTFSTGDFVIDQTGAAWVCTAAGTPGTWSNVGGAITASNHAGNLASAYNVTGSLATFLTTASLGVGTWLVSLDATVTASSHVEIQATTGTATATLAGCTSTEVLGTVVQAALTFVATVTGSGTLVFQAIGSGNQIGSTTYASGYANATGYTAVRIA